MTQRVHRGKKGADKEGEETPPIHFGHRLRADHIILGSDLTKGSEGEQACFVEAFAMTQRTVDHNIQALQKFGGTRAHGKALCVVRSDAAAEITEAVNTLVGCLRQGLHMIFFTTESWKA